MLACVLLCTAACSANSATQGTASPASEEHSDRLNIVTSVFAPYDFTRTLAGDAASVSMLVPPGAETHSFEPSPADLVTLSKADVFIYVGGESDVWLDKILASLDNPDLTLVTLTSLVSTLDEELLEGMDTREQAEAAAPDTHEAEDASHEETPFDEHVWTSLRNAQIIVQSLAKTFAELDGAHAELYHTNAEAYIRELASLDIRITEITENAKRKTLVMADRFPFRYFAADYNLECFAAFPGCSTAVDTSPETIAFLIDKVQAEGIPVVFYRELSDQRIAQTVAEATGAEVHCFHSTHNISKEDLESGASYLSLMQANANILEVALN